MSAEGREARQAEAAAVKTAGLIVLGAGISGLLAWFGVRRSTWLKHELAYRRWRRHRFHTVILQPPAAVLPQHLASGRALVWDGRTDQASL